MNIWTVAREYAGIAEAGGVKNVTRSLSESLVRSGEKVTLFIPLYGCTDLSAVEDFCCCWHRPVKIQVCGREMTISFSHGRRNGVEIVFIGNRAFSEKQAVYTYTEEEEAENPAHRKGQGHEDAQFLNTLFQKAVVAYGETCAKEENPAIIHCHDATAAMLAVFVHFARKENKTLASVYRHTRFVVTIHNAGAGYHHEYSSLDSAVYFTGLDRDFLAQGLNGACVEPFVLASRFACLTTVSPQYAEEIMAGSTDTGGLSPLFARDRVKVTGITNGVDCGRYNPADTSVSLLPAAFDIAAGDFDGKYACRSHFLTVFADRNATLPARNTSVRRYGFLAAGAEEAVYIAYHGRVVRQKGISILATAARRILENGMNARFIFLGQGERELEGELEQLSQAFPGSVVYFKGYDRALSRLCMAAADIAVFPSNFEPCGTEDFIAQLYGSLCLAHATGGLRKIIDGETGFLYEPNDTETLAGFLSSLIRIAGQAGKEIFHPMLAYTARYITANYSWDKVASEKYRPLFRSLLGDY